MTRLFHAYGSFKCAVCHKHPSIGWLYRCTQDTGGFLPESDFTEVPCPSRSRADQHVTTHSLSSSVVKAIGEGHYTDEQVKKLIQQKEGVRRLVMSEQPSADSRPPTSSTFSTASSSSSDGDCTFSTIPQSTTFSTTSSTSLDEEIKQAYDWKELQKVWMSEPSMAPPEPRAKSLSTMPIPSPPLAGSLPQPPKVLQPQDCTFKICHTCRPTCRERAYQSLEDILNRPVQMPPTWELQNRRVSDARIVARIGLPKLDRFRFYEQMGPAALHSSCTIPGIVIDDSDGEVDYYDPATEQYIAYVPGADSRPCESQVNKNDGGEGHSQDNQPAENHSNDQVDLHSVDKRSSFRQTIRKALTRARRDGTTSIDSNTDTSDPESVSHIRPQPPSRPSSSLIFRRCRSRASTLSFVETPGARVVDTSPLQESVMLMVATNTPLPQTPSMNGFDINQGVESRLIQDKMDDQESYFPQADIISQA
ncbi:hypothetical protein A1O7_08728 [Cladophialophora yegresii CBS 114405]|uniref:Uncharacterized protein n=1 Tax=Cladophialophora yegresii CBS 114405 TaxID=1182544 RepID=W9VJV3_9EURO|nr:uncharacterized protein A1O7_08728 [Cladophialophora yegresii CBS 114405]EXJ55798.1 hypothetical protein A1O7_08728 [Cladophialophora yegresii CBS 114405]